MKAIIVLTILGFLYSAIGCSKEKSTPTSEEFTVEEYSQVVVDGAVKVVFKRNKKQKKINSIFKVIVIGSEKQRKNISVESKNGVLTIIADEGIVWEDGVVVELVATDKEPQGNEQKLKLANV